MRVNVSSYRIESIIKFRVSRTPRLKLLSTISILCRSGCVISGRGRFSLIRMSVVRRILRSRHFGFVVRQKRTFSVSPRNLDGERRSYRMVVVGGGTAGCSIASKFGSHFGQGKVAVVEPSDVRPEQSSLQVLQIKRK